MTALSDALLTFAEEPDSVLGDILPPALRIITPRFTIVLSPAKSQSTTSTVRTTAAELDDTIAAARALLREQSFTGNVWQVGPSCRPKELGQMLMERGFVPVTRAPYEPRQTAMALTSEPPPLMTPGIEARLVRDLDEFVLAIRVAMETFNESEEDAAKWIAAAPAFWKSHDGTNRFTHIAYLDGKPVGFGFAASGPVGVLLGGSGVLPAARGRGVYRALLAARWAEAVKLRRPGLVVQAGAMSRPILERCGFQVVCQLDLFDDIRFAEG